MFTLNETFLSSTEKYKIYTAIGATAASLLDFKTTALECLCDKHLELRPCHVLQFIGIFFYQNSIVQAFPLSPAHGGRHSSQKKYNRQEVLSNRCERFEYLSTDKISKLFTTSRTNGFHR